MALSTLGTVSSAMPRPVLVVSRPICQICDAITVRRLNTAKTLITGQNVSRPRRPPALCDGIRRIQGFQSRILTRSDRPRSFASSTGLRSSEKTETLEQPEDAEHEGEIDASLRHRTELSSVTNMVAFLENSKAKILGHRGIPTEADISAALQACKVVADYIKDESVQPQISHMVTEMDSTASHLLSLDSAGRQKKAPATQSDKESVSTQLKQMIDKISDTAYAILAHATVFITPSVLKQYVDVQARLGRPETLPQVFHLYASKPLPREASGSISYMKQNPHKATNAIGLEIVEIALDTAIEAKNLDAAVGIVENSLKTKAFVRSKLLHTGFAPAFAFFGTPIAAYILATKFSAFHNAMDPAIATQVGFIGILGYVGFTASLGFIVIATANDQMRRVSWAASVPLRSRWLREEERMAFDKIACAWGFKDKTRWGEEKGADWDALREYLGQKDMLLDRTELLEGLQ